MKPIRADDPGPGAPARGMRSFRPTHGTPTSCGPRAGLRREAPREAIVFPGIFPLAFGTGVTAPARIMPGRLQA